MVEKTHAKPSGQRERIFDLEERTVEELQRMMHEGHLDARALVEGYLARIQAIDRGGPHLNSIIELNPDAQAMAAELDRERKAHAVRGPLHGICVLIKDNIATGDRMQTTAGSLALAGSIATRDAHLVARLREAGAVILGKTNLSEWANIRSSQSTSGWSGRGGLTRNPYALDRTASGSSSGSGAAIAASLATVAIGTETDGSIVSPASMNGLVGIKPTRGLVSRDGIIPIAQSQDTAGPMARCVSDAAALLSVIAGSDPADPATAQAQLEDYVAALRPDALKGARLGVVRAVFGENRRVKEVMELALRILASQGATIVDPVTIPNAEKYDDSELEVLLYELKDGLNRYLAQFAPTAPVKNLAELIDWNQKHAEVELKFFGQELFIKAQAKGDLTSEPYLQALENNGRYARTEGLDVALREQKLDALIAPTAGPAALIDLVNGDHFGNSFSSPAAVAGYPHVTVPAGSVFGLPIGLSFVGPAYSESRLIGYAYAYEQASKERRPPRFAKSVTLAI